MAFTSTKPLFFLAVAFGATLLSGCEEPAQTVQWYKDHPAEMDKKWESCKASGNDTQNCRNATEAHFQVKQKNAPVLDLNNISNDDIKKE